jgi:cell division protein ZapA
MSTVTLTIGPQSYTIACADGEEAHVAALGAVIAEKYALLGTSRAPLEAQNILFAALFMADELAEARKKVASASAEHLATLVAQVADLEAKERSAAKENDRLADALRKAEAQLAQKDLFGAASAPADFADRLEALAAQAESLASALEAGPANA